MSTNVQDTGDHGQLRIDVAIVSGNRVCDFYIRSTSVVAVPGLNWSWYHNSSSPVAGTFNFQSTTLWQHLGTATIAPVTAGSTDTVTLHLADTGTAQLAGPTDLVVDLTAISTTSPTQIGATSTLETGDHGQLRIDNLSNTDAKTCDLYIRSTSVVAVPNLGWGWALNDATPSLQTFNFQATTLWQHLGLVYVGHAASITLHLTDTGTAQLGGPTDLKIDLSSGASSVTINVSGNLVQANPFVNVDGVWKPADAFVKVNGDWSTVT